VYVDAVRRCHGVSQSSAQLVPCRREIASLRSQ
jgi:hypothetical protein